MSLKFEILGRSGIAPIPRPAVKTDNRFSLGVAKLPEKNAVQTGNLQIPLMISPRLKQKTK